MGKKLQKGLDEKIIEMKGRVKAKKKLVIRLCGKIHIASVIDSHSFNTDHVPIWYESVGNYR